MIKTTVAADGFEGILFPVGERKDKVVIVVSGSNGGMSLTKSCAEFYHRNGIAALAVAIFRTKGTQKNLDRVPMEYIESAIQWLKRQGYEKIGMDGTSKGSELALLSATMFQDLSCVIARVPSYFVSEGLIAHGKSKKPSGTSCWSYHGQEIPFARYHSREFHILKTILKEKELNLLAVNGEKTVLEETIIPIEKIKGPILLLSSRNDTVWPSYESSMYMEERLKEKAFSFPYKHVAFPHLSHAMLTEISVLYKLGFQSERQHAEQCAKERKQLADELIDWVENVWN